MARRYSKRGGSRRNSGGYNRGGSRRSFGRVQRGGRQSFRGRGQQTVRLVIQQQPQGQFFMPGMPMPGQAPVGFVPGEPMQIGVPPQPPRKRKF